jgi:hypothetical protein
MSDKLRKAIAARLAKNEAALTPAEPKKDKAEPKVEEPKDTKEPSGAQG